MPSDVFHMIAGQERMTVTIRFYIRAWEIRYITIDPEVHDMCIMYPHDDVTTSCV